MRRLALLAVASITSLALATPALTVTANAADGTSDRVVQADHAKKKKKSKITKLKRSEKGVQPGITGMKITANVSGKGKVKFTIKGVGHQDQQEGQGQEGQGRLQGAAARHRQVQGHRQARQVEEEDQVRGLRLGPDASTRPRSRSRLGPASAGPGAVAAWSSTRASRARSAATSTSTRTATTWAARPRPTCSASLRSSRVEASPTRTSPIDVAAQVRRRHLELPGLLHRRRGLRGLHLVHVHRRDGHPLTDG